MNPELNLNLIRFFDNGITTLGKLHVDHTFFCFTLEDTYREDKIFKKTRIDHGRYKILLRKEGGLYPKYLKKYKTDGMLWLQDVDNYEWVYLHPGKTHVNTHGCPLVGAGYSNYNGKINLFKSRQVYQDLHWMVSNTLKVGKTFINIFDNY